MERCTICDRDLSTLTDEGCEHCGLEYDPLAPDRATPLDFNKEVRTTYVPEDEFDFDSDDMMGDL